MPKSSGIRLFTEALSLGFTAWFLWAPISLASTPGRVEAVLAPAWLERNGRQEPLTPGTEIRNGDIVKTGSGSRAYLMLAEGSRVKLGETARFEFHDSSAEQNGMFRGVFNVAAGAFRFTTGLLQKARGRDVTIRVATATIGIRGTDVWGRALPDSELVALIEGKIQLSREGQMFSLDPMNFMVARRGEAGQVRQFDLSTLQSLAAETEITAGGAVTTGGAWLLEQEGVADQSQAIAVYDRLRAAGYPARIRPMPSKLANGAEWTYSVFISGFASAEEAHQVARSVKSTTGAELAPRKPGKK